VIRSPARDRATQSAESAAKSMWLISFTDLMSLMLGFFVMLYGMTQPDHGKFKEIARGLSARSTASGYSDRPPVPSAAFNGAVIETNSRLGPGYVHVLLRAQIKESPELAGVESRLEDDRVVVAIPRAKLFGPDGRSVGDEGRRTLFLLGAAVGRSGNRVEVVSTAEPIAGPAGAAWELALVRSAATAAAMRAVGWSADLVARAVSASPGSSPAGGVDLVVRDRER